MNEYLWTQFPDYDLANKKKNYSDYITYFFNRTRRMFHYEGLPSTIPERELEIQLQMFGHCGVFQYKGNLYALKGNLCGKPNEYYMPTEYIIANPALNLSKTFKIDEDIVIFRNDSLFKGILPLVSRTATQMTENDLSMLLADINSRMITLISATSDNTVEGAKKYLKDVIAGKLGVIADDAFFEGLKINSAEGGKGAEVLTNLIEYQQYLKASLWNDLGLEANYNMKREAINSSEAQMNSDALYPLVDDMMQSRKECVEQINEMFGTNISVEYSGVWAKKEAELDAEEEILESSEEEFEATAENELEEVKSDEIE